MVQFVLLLGAIWGVIIAVAIEYTALGRWIAERMTWLSVVAGVGGDLLLLLLLADEAGRVLWWQVAAVIAVSSAGVIYRGLWQAHRYFAGLMEQAAERDERPRRGCHDDAD